MSREFSDNIYASRTNRTSDWTTVLNPFANLRINGEDGTANIGGSATLGRYSANTAENYDDYRVYANGRYNFSPRLSMASGASFDRLHEERSSPDARPGVTPTIYSVTSAYAAGRAALDRGTFQLGATFDRFDYDNVAAVGGGTIVNDDRDRDVATIGARLGHQLNEQYEAFGTFTYDVRNYRLPVDDFGYQKDSNGIRFAVGLRRKAGPFDVEGYFGGLRQDYSDPRFGDIFVPDFGGRVLWTGIPGTTVSGKLERRLLEADVQGASGYVETAADLDVIHWIRPDLRVNGRVSYRYDEFNGVSRQDQVATVGLGIRDYVTPHFYLGADVSLTNRDSTDLNYSYTESRAILRAGVVQDPAYTEADLKKSDVPLASDGGLYVGAQSGVSTLGTKLFGSRGNGGTLQADFGDDVWASTLFAGYRINFGNWFVGLEADIGKSSGEWDHQHTPNERIYSVSRNMEYGLSGIVGRYFQGGTTLYGKAGVVAAEFQTNYQLGTSGTQDRRTQSGIRIGMGGTAPISRDLSVRLEHTFASFKDYNIDCCIKPAGGSPDNFANSESMTSFGLVYSFGGVPGAVQPAQAIDYRGFYLGGQIGHQSLTTWTTGPRSSGTTLTADYADDGYSAGAFAGAGMQFGDLYIGSEFEVEIGKVHGDQERDPTGRSYSVEQQWSLGTSVRGGIVLNKTALLYARLGFVQSRLHVDYVTGSGKLVSADYTEFGLRYGGGLEIPTSNNLLVRLDYTHTDYPEISLTTPDQGVQRYRPNDDLFRAGLLYLFGGI